MTVVRESLQYAEYLAFRLGALKHIFRMGPSAELGLLQD